MQYCTAIAALQGTQLIPGKGTDKVNLIEMEDNFYLRILNALSLKLCLYFTHPGVQVINRQHYCNDFAAQSVSWLNMHPG
jgi:hypothetical protein